MVDTVQTVFEYQKPSETTKLVDETQKRSAFEHEIQRSHFDRIRSIRWLVIEFPVQIGAGRIHEPNELVQV